MMEDHDHHHPADDRSFWSRNSTRILVLSAVIFGAAIVVEFFAYRWDVVLFREWGVVLTLSESLYLLTVVLSGSLTVKSGLRSILSLRMSIDFLITMALVGALALGKTIEAASLAFLYGVAESLEDYAMIRARSSIRELLELAPQTARVRRDSTEREVPVEEIEVGETVIVRPGEKLAMDGDVIEGRSTVNEAPVTGESMPAEKQPGDRVFAGTLNQEGYLEYRVTKSASENTLSRIVEMIEEAESRQAPSQRFVDRFASYYTPSVVTLALLIGVVVPFVPGVTGDFSTWWLRAMALLVIACPCGLLVSTPITVVSGISSAARHGTLIKGGEPFETMGRIDVICFDKTGTLTVGEPSVDRVRSLDGTSSDQILSVAAALESRSEHHLARAIVKSARERGLDWPEVEQFESITASGVSGRIDGTEYFVGKPELFEDSAPTRAGELAGEGHTVVCVGTRTAIQGFISITDQLRPEAADAVSRLRELGMEVVMITGDNESSARDVADRLGIDHVHAQLLPEDKVEEVQTLRRRHGSIAMVGDGVNDAPALAAADVGVAMGAAGTDTALETADIALLGDDLTRLAYVVRLSQAGERVIQQNIGASILVKLVLGLGVIPGWVNLITAVVVGDMGVTFGITGNALRLRRIMDREP